MPLNLASPGIVIREVDLTIGRVDPTSGSTGALVAPFAKGPVNDPQLIESEEDLLQTFGQPYSTDKHFEHWMVASSYLAYGGTLQVVRAGDQAIFNASATVGAATSIRIDSAEHYKQLGFDENKISNQVVVAKNPGTWANGIKVALIDGKADQVLTGFNSGDIDGTIAAGDAVIVSVPTGADAITINTNPETGETKVLDGHYAGVVSELTNAGVGSFGVKLVTHVAGDGTITPVDYQQNGNYTFPTTGVATFISAGNTVGHSTAAYTNQYDWFEDQTIELSNGSLEWDQLSNRPTTSGFVAARGGRFDEVHVVVIDDTGDITGNAGTILEKHLALSKATDAEYSVGSTSYWRKYIETNSKYIFAGNSPAGALAVAWSNNSNYTLDGDAAWDQPAQGVNFQCGGAQDLTLSGGKLYGNRGDTATEKAIHQPGALHSGVDDIISGLTLFENTEETDVDFILMGSANYPKATAQALANKCIAVAEARKDAVAFISPYRQAFLNDSTSGSVTVNNIDQITDNVVGFYAPVTSSTYGVLDSGYKYMFDRFNNTFRYVPCNGDIAGTCARTSLEQFPWFSPAGTARGAILNAVKLIYNPGKKQRDILYSNRINPVILSPGAGIILFGDKTAFGKASAFDRINVRRLFIFLEDAISAAAKDQLFEFNDELTRTNFVNIIEPFLRDVQAKRGIFDFVVICDETNNTAAVIDANEFVADIFIKPARSINFIGLTFVATRTGVAFEEVIGSV